MARCNEKIKADTFFIGFRQEETTALRAASIEIEYGYHETTISAHVRPIESNGRPFPGRKVRH